MALRPSTTRSPSPSAEPATSSTATAGGTGSGGGKSPRTGPLRDATAIPELTRQADLLASRGQYVQALELVQEAVRLDPQRAELHCGLGQCLINLGRYEEAKASFDEARRVDPQHRFAVRGKAMAAVRQQDWKEAVAHLREALSMDRADNELRMDIARCLTELGIKEKERGHAQPHLFHEALQAWEAHGPAYFQLGVEYSGAEDHAQAKEMYMKAVQASPEYVEAWNNLGVTCRILMQPEEAVEAYQRALRFSPNCKKTRENMAICLLEAGSRSLQQKDYKTASSMLKQALGYNSQNADVYFNLGVLYTEKQKWNRAKTHLELAIHFDPAHANALNNLGVLQRRFGNPEAAMLQFEQALNSDPKMGLANKNLGGLYGTIGRMAESIRLLQQALEANPEDAEAHNNLALLFRDRCDVEACLEHLDRCLELEPKSQHAHSNRLMTLNYPSEKTREEVFEAHRSWGEQLERKITPMFTSWRAQGQSNGLIRVGYISPDLFCHSVSYFIEAALRHHDPAFVHVTCYSDVQVEDGKTQMFKGLVPNWRSINGKSDEEVAQIIHDDAIDILVELTGHTGNNRLACLARRPAPVIVTWIGYPHTTGLSRVNYRISDDKADPPQMPGLTTEQLMYLPECFLCYTPPHEAPPISFRPAQETYGCPTFGCFNNLAKVSTLTIRLWCRVLKEVPEARLFMKSKALQCSEVQQKFRKAFSAHGIESHRLDLSGLQPQTGSHLQMYNLVDIALDTAPYAGTTTTCEALYMGVPVISLRGQGIHAQNVGASLLSAVQLQDLVADTEKEYVQKAAALARDTTRLRALRAGLRQRMLRSVLCDGPRHTARLERLYANIVARSSSAGEPCVGHVASKAVSSKDVPAVGEERAEESEAADDGDIPPAEVQ